MSHLGRLHCFLIATQGVGNVVYERFYDRLSEYEKADVRAAFQLASSNVRFEGEQEDFIGVYKSACFVFIPVNDMVFYLMGSGEYDELACSGILRALGLVLQDVLRTKLTSGALLEKYGKLCCIIDEVINEGILETTDRDIIRKALKHKAVWE